MSSKITVYVGEELHRRLKAAASMRGQSLSDFMLQAARLMLEMPDRRRVAVRMERVRRRIGSGPTADEVRLWREEGRL